MIAASVRGGCISVVDERLGIHQERAGYNVKLFG